MDAQRKWIVTLDDLNEGYCQHVGVADSEQAAYDGGAEWIANSGENRDWREWAERALTVHEVEAF